MKVETPAAVGSLPVKIKVAIKLMGELEKLTPPAVRKLKMENDGTDLSGGVQSLRIRNSQLNGSSETTIS